MSSQSCDEILESIEILSLQELRDKMDDLLPKLISSLRQEEENCKAVRIIHVLLDSFLPLLKIDNVESKIFKSVLPVMKQLFLETVNGIRYTFESKESTDKDSIVDQVEDSIKVCLSLLDSVQSALQYILTNGKVNVNEITSLPKNVTEILLEAFKHCRESEKLYGDFFQDLGECLSILFKKSHTIQGHLISALTDNITFNCSYEGDLVLFIEVLEVIELIGEIVTGLDIKTTANQWKLYAKLVQENVESLKQRIDISRPVKFLSLDTKAGLKSILESDLSDSKNIIKNLKILNFNMKLIMLFCELYVGYLGECHEELFSLMIFILSNSHPYLQVKVFPNNVIDEVESYLVIGVEPLIIRLIEEVELSKVYFQFCKNLEHEGNLKLGFLLVSKILLNKLIHCNDEVRKYWLQNDKDHNIIFVIFRSLEYSHVELTMNLRLKGSCKGTGAEGKDATHGLYESLLIHLSAFVVTVPARSISMLEETLLENILGGNGNIWRGLMATDVWCMVARCGSGEFCFQQLCQLSKLAKSMLENKSCPEASYLRMLLCRLFPLLSKNHMVQMAEVFPPISNPRLWHLFGLGNLPQQWRFKLQEEFLTNATREIGRFFSNSPTVNVFKLMMDAMIGAAAALESLSYEQEKEIDTIRSFTYKLVDLWSSVPLSDFRHNNTSKWLDNFFRDISVVTSSAVRFFNNNQTLQILGVLQNTALQNVHSCKLATLKLLKSLGKKFFTSDSQQAQVCQRISSMFSVLLRDNNALVQQLSLETFTYFSQVTQHEQIVPLSVSGSEDLKKMVSNYLMKVPFHNIFAMHISEEEYLRKQSLLKSLHWCRAIENKYVKGVDMLKSDIFKAKSEVPDHNQGQQKRKLQEDLSVVVKRMKEDVEFIAKASEQSSLPSEMQEEVQQMISKLTRLT